MAKKTTVADVRKSAAKVGTSGARVLKSMALAAAGSVLGTVESAAETGQAALRGVGRPRKHKTSARRRVGAKKAGATRKVRSTKKRAARKLGSAKRTAKRVAKKAKARAATAKRSVSRGRKTSKRR